MTISKSQEITNELRDEIKRLRGSAMRRRDKRISNTLKQVHKPYDQRPNENIVQHDGTILFDLTLSKQPMTATGLLVAMIVLNLYIWSIMP